MAARAPFAAFPSRRHLIDVLTRRIVGLGGLGVITAIALLFVYLVWVVAPLFIPAGLTTGVSFGSDAPPLFLDLNESGELVLTVHPEQGIRFLDAASGAVVLAVPLPRDVVEVRRVDPAASTYVARSADGGLTFFEARYAVSFEGEERRLTPTVEWLFGATPVTLPAAVPFDVRLESGVLEVAWHAGGTVTRTRYRDADPTFELEAPETATLGMDVALREVLFGPRGRWLYAIDVTGTAHVITSSGRRLQRGASSAVASGDDPVRATGVLLGRYSLVVALESGKLSQWILTRVDGEQTLVRVRSFDPVQDVAAIVPEQRRKGFAVLTGDGELTLYHATSQRRLAWLQLPAGSFAAAAYSPRGRQIAVVDGAGQFTLVDVRNDHPEISFRALWGEVWYEGYETPVYRWQSSSGDNEFEPKFSLTPLLFGTLKAAFYAMLVAMPIAILGAIYTAYFMAPAMRRFVKPGIEIMAALPTVILGFLAGLWLAPLVEANLAALVAAVVIVPLGLLVLAWATAFLPESAGRKLAGWYGLAVIPAIVVLGWSALALGPDVERVVFGGDTRAWLLDVLGLQYDQRNALVVGIAMGFAVIPVIFTIAEDAVYSVPGHLRNGSLALGATEWQTLTRVVLLTASPGIFSAVMIGFGRAVGETMIVLMATGNTPILDMNVFEGMRTFAANIAVELPESEVDSTHYRILFLTALVLFLMTFVFNTIAELVRARLRVRYGDL